MQQPTLPQEVLGVGATYQQIDEDLHQLTFLDVSRQAISTIFSFLHQILDYYEEKSPGASLTVGILIDKTKVRTPNLAYIFNELRKVDQRWKKELPTVLHPGTQIRIAVIHRQGEQGLTNIFPSMFSSLRWRQFYLRYFQLEDQEEAIGWLRF